MSKEIKIYDIVSVSVEDPFKNELLSGKLG